MSVHTSNMSWRQAWFELLNGRKVKLPTWKGYWKWEDNTIKMHCSDGTILDVRETTNPAYTFTNIAENYWMVVDDDYELDNQNTTDPVMNALNEVLDTMGSGTSPYDGETALPVG